MDIEDFVVETTIYEIICCECGDRTEEHQDGQNAIDEAEGNGFRFIGDGVYCRECIEKL